MPRLKYQGKCQDKPADFSLDSKNGKPKTTRPLGSINPDEFQSVEAGCHRCQQAIDIGRITFENRTHFLAEWVRFGRQLSKPNKFTNPTACFNARISKCLKSDDWFASDTDRDAANDYLKQRDRDEAGQNSIPELTAIADGMQAENPFKEIHPDDFNLPS